MATGEELRIYLLGSFRVTIGQRTIGEHDWKLRKARSLLKLLALAPNHRLHREQVMDLLWPDLEPTAAANNLRKILHVARQTLNANAPSTERAPADASPLAATRSRPDRSGFLNLESESIVLRSTGALWIDVEAFETAAAIARRTQEPQAFRKALELYTGDLLPEDLYEDWLARRRDELHGTYISLLLELARLHKDKGELGSAIEAIKHVITVDPLHEQAHTELMRLYTLSGERRKALHQYQQLRDILRRELDVEPEVAATRLYEEIVVGRASAPRTVEAHKHNLPAQLTSFIGRQKETAEVIDLLSSARLLTLTGPGGCGKTRLAIELAANLLAQYPDGVWLVELASLSDPALVAQAVASVLHFQEQPGRTLTETLCSLLEAKECLLILDNCEHLIESCAKLTETLLRSCPDLQILATSREPLNIPGETAWAVPSLSLPERGLIPSLESLGRYEATRLFIDRAMHVLSNFTVLQRDAPVIARICLQLDGIPLAIELAAARVKVLTVEQIAERLNDSFRWLGEGSRTASPRHQTLSAAIGWSYNLLAPKEQALFRRLSVFAGAFSLEAVEAVCAGGLVGQGEVLDLLSHLIDKSLVLIPGPERTVSDKQGRGSEVRYRLLETLRQYGRERLEDNGEVEVTEHRHAGYFQSLVERAEPHLRGPQQVAWLELLDREIDNLRAALDWSQRHNAETGLAIAGGLWWFWEARGYHTEGRRWLHRLLPQAPDRTLTRARALHSLGAIAMRQGERTITQAALTESLDIFREAGDRQGVADVLERTGLSAYALGNYTESRRVLKESLDLFRTLDNTIGIGWTLSDLGMVARIEGNYEEARIYLEESLSHLRESGDRLGLAYALNSLGQLMRVEGNFARAQELLEESLAAAREVEDKLFTGWALMCLGEVARRLGNSSWARTCFIEAIQIASEVGYTRHVSVGLGALGVMAAEQGNYQRCVRLMSTAFALHGWVRASLDVDEKVSWDESLAAARAALGQSGMDAAWDEGQAMMLNKGRTSSLAQVDLEQIETPDLRKGGIERAIEYAKEES